MSRRRFFSRRRRGALADRSARIGVALAAGMLALALGGPLVLPDRANRINLAEKLAAPSVAHPLGTDQYGRDQLARLVGGARRSLGASLAVMVGVLAIGLTIGVAAGMAGGWVDAAAMRAMDVLLAMPPLVLALAVVGVLGVGFGNLLLALIVSSVAGYVRLARGEVGLARQRQDVIVARLAGVSWPRVTFGHVVPGVVAQLLVVATLDFSGVIIGVASLSFLGLGAQPPDAEWGTMLAESRLFFLDAPWLLLAPAAAISLTVVAANLVGEALRRAIGVGSG